MYQLSTLNFEQLNNLKKTIRGQKAIREYELIKTKSQNFSQAYEELAKVEGKLYRLILKILEEADQAKNPQLKLRKISWKVELSVEDLQPYGKIYELKTLAGTCSKIGLVLNKKTSIFVKGNKNVQARKGELIEFVCSNTEKGKYRQFNIIGNIKDKCIFTAQLYKNGKRREIECKKEQQKEDSQANKQSTKVEYSKVPDTVDISWKNRVSIKDLHEFGKIYELKTDEDTVNEIGLIVYRKTTVFTKENKTINISQGGLLKFICLSENECEYQYYSTIKNYQGKCLLKTRLYKDGSREQLDCNGKPIKPKTKKEKNPCPPTPCEEKKKAKPKPQQYASEKKQGQALAELVYLYGSDAQLGNAEQIITKIMRRTDNRIVLQMNEYKNTRGGAKAVKGTEQFFLFQEKDRKLLKSEMPKDYTLVDAKMEVLKDGEKAKANTLDKVYSKKEEIQLCAEIEKEMLKCKEGACSPEQKAYYQKLMEECSEKAGKQQFFKDLEKQFMRVFNGQKRGESFWQAYNRIESKTA